MDAPLHNGIKRCRSGCVFKPLYRCLSACIDPVHLEDCLCNVQTDHRSVHLKSSSCSDSGSSDPEHSLVWRTTPAMHAEIVGAPVLSAGASPFDPLEAPFVTAAGLHDAQTTWADLGNDVFVDAIAHHRGRGELRRHPGGDPRIGRLD